MATIDVFNGDADGICALIQCRLANPSDSILVTGVKRDIKLLDKVKESVKKGDKITVLDISMEKNQDGLQHVLAAGAKVFYVDHHLSGETPNHPALTAIIDTSADTCTSLLVDKYLNGKYKEWAIVAAFGDNMTKSAEKEATLLSLKEGQIAQLRRLGISINYNGYGSSMDDLYFKPDELYQEMATYTSPLDFINDSQSVYQELQNGYDLDIAKTSTLKPYINKPNIAIYHLPDEDWARRVSGVFGNQLANKHPDKAHAILTQHPISGYVVSVRAPLNKLGHADDLCKQFPTGGGRKGAAGINQLPTAELEQFSTLFDNTYK